MKKTSLLSYFSPNSSKLPSNKENDKDQDSDNVNTNFSQKAKKRKSVLKESLCLSPITKINKPEESSNSAFVSPDSPTIDFTAFLAQSSKKIPLETTEETFKKDISLIQQYPHCTYKFLMTEFIKDKQGHSINHFDYDPTTLYVPESFLASRETTPAMKQWWRIKSDNFDCVLLFKVGKFYELYHMDAEIGVKELGLTFMRGKFAHAGFPEISFPTYSSALIEKGYKVARIEQTEKPSDVVERNKQKDKTDSNEKLVRRDLCSIVSSSTRIFDAFDVDLDNCSTYSSSSIGFGLLLAVVENIPSWHDSKMFEVGICLIDTSIANFTLAQFRDDRSLSNLRTLLAQTSNHVTEIIAPKGAISQFLSEKIKKCVGLNKIQMVSANCSSERTIKELLANNYFMSKKCSLNLSTSKTCSQIMTTFPPALDKLISCSEGSISTSDLTLSSLGCAIHVLKRHLIDEHIIPVGNFSIYDPLTSQQVHHSNQTNMILDETALKNLDILVSSEGYTGKYGTILSLVNHCVTPFGKRKMVRLVCYPLFKNSDIIDRLDAVENLLCLGIGKLNELRRSLASVTDLEKLLVRLHSVGILHYSSSHPQNKAVIFNEKFFNKKKIDDLTSIILGFEKAFSFYSEIGQLHFNSSLLHSLLNFQFDLDETSMIDLNSLISLLSELKNSFDFSRAKKEGIVVPNFGYIPAYDAAVDKISAIEREFDEYLSELKYLLNCQTIKYCNVDSARYLLEVPTSVDEKLIPTSFEFKSQRKGFKRFLSPKSQQILARLLALEQEKAAALSNVFVKLIEKIIPQKKKLYCFIHHLAMIDCILSLAYFSSGCVTNSTLTRPKIMDCDSPVLEIRDGYHPCLAITKSNVISNNIELNQQNSTTLLITGPNMGGKSTLIRQTAIIVILAQVGCYVPCSSCKLTPVDRIFARLGAAFDNPKIGESTFYVELAETSVMLKSATHRSLLLLDELGRGTATHDGLSLAFAVLKYISTSIKSLTLFSTHYHYIAREIINQREIRISTVFMECLVHDSVKDENDNSYKNITFLYRVKNGICPKSYGFHVARLAGIPIDLVRRAEVLAKEMERNNLINELSQVRNSPNKIDAVNLVKKIITF